MPTLQTQWYSASCGVRLVNSPLFFVLAFDAPIPWSFLVYSMFFSNATIGVFANHFGGWKAVMKICFVMGIIKWLSFCLGNPHLCSIWYWSLTAGWVWLTGALVFHLSCKGISSSSMFFFVILALAGVYMFFASKQLRAEEDAEAAAETMTAVTPEGIEVEVAVPGNRQQQLKLHLFLQHPKIESHQQLIRNQSVS